MGGLKFYVMFAVNSFIIINLSGALYVEIGSVKDIGKRERDM